MLYVVAVLVAVAVAVTLWKLLGPQHNSGGGVRPERPMVAPDDDPDFLRELDKRSRQQDDDDTP